MCKLVGCSVIDRLAVLAEDLSSVSITHDRLLTAVCDASSRRSSPFSGLLRYFVHVPLIHADRQTHICTQLRNKI